ncbi:MAG: 50S ribosomal protein L19e [Nanoarchaeota archaeon]|nr:50S ribosomal protein L19e [Nanoarchaeota archaeon]
MKSLKTQKRVAASLLKSGSNRVVIKSDNLSDVKSAITREDVRGLIVKGIISKKKVKGISRGRARVIQAQKKKGRRKGFGNRKGAKNARTPKKRLWVNRVRAQRKLVKDFKSKELIDNNVFTKTYSLIKGGFFRSRSHIKVYLNDHGLINKVKK